MEWEARLRTALTEPAYGLAALRVAVVAVLLVTPELGAARSLSRSPELLVAAPEGLGWLGHVQFSPGLVDAVHTLALSAGATALLGYWARVSCGLFGLSATFLLSFAERSGAALHGMHLLWLLALLSVSPCADVWSLDAWGKRGAPASPAYGVPLCAARLLLGAVYFFPGLHKLLSAGLSWGSAENVTAILYSKWFQHGRLPLLRIDTSPSLLAWGGAAVLVFELSFWLLALLPATRLLALLAGLTFHIATQLFFFISFPSLWVCYVVLVPWQRAFLKRFTWTMPGQTARFPWPSAMVGALLLGGAVAQGARGQTQAFPFACYPTFAGLFPRLAPDLLVELVRPDGSSVRLGRDTRQYRTQQQWGQVYWLLGAYGGVASDEQLRQFARRLARSERWRSELRAASALRFLIAEYSTVPSDRGRPPVRLRLLRQLSGGA
jgi:hypothetical protein